MKRIGIWLGLAAGLTLAAPAIAQVPVAPEVTAAFSTYERVTVIVSLVPPAIDASAGNAAMRQAIRDRQQVVIDAVGPDLVVDTRYATIPALGVQVTAAGLAALQAHPLVAAIAANRVIGTQVNRAAGELALAPRPVDPARAAGLGARSLTSPQPDGRGTPTPQSARPPAPTAATRLAQPENLRVIGAPAVWSAGHVGAGQFVAVLDSGIEASHPAFAGKTIVEACFSSQNPAELMFSLCPGRALYAMGPGAASACPDSNLVESCVHGTHVAGIATGNDPVAAVYGVAPQADVIAIQVFSRYWNSRIRNWAIGAVTLDYVSALDYVADLAQQSPGRIAAANMSLGGDTPQPNFCDTGAQAAEDPSAVAVAMAINALRDASVTTAIAAGNEGFRGAVGSPACVTPAVSVAATNAGDTYSVNADTNLAAFPLVFVAAPGDLILSAVPGGGYARFSGTSMATPMIAGALAVLHAAYPGYQAFDYETALVRGGKALLLDGQFRLPRLDLPTTDAILAGNAGGSSLSGPYQAASPVSYVQYPARGNEAWSWYKQQLYVP